MEETILKREIILYTDNSNIKLYYSVPTCLNNDGQGYYVDEVMLFAELNEDYLKEHVYRVYVEMLDGEIPSIHHSFCRELAKAWDAELFFNFDGIEFRINKDTPDDWWDISIEDAIQLHKEQPDKVNHVGPYYVNLEGELLKKSLWLCSVRINEIDNTIVKGIQYDYPDLCHTWRDEFDNYLEYRSWNTERLMEVFIMRRRIKRYCDLLRDYNDTFTQEDADRFKKEYEETMSEETTTKKKRRSRKKESKTTDIDKI